MTGNGFYEIKMTDMLLNGVSLGFDPKIYNSQHAPITCLMMMLEITDISVSRHCIVDSGTPMPTLPVKVFAAIQALFEKSCSGPKPLKGVCNMSKGKSLFDGTYHSLPRTPMLH